MRPSLLALAAALTLSACADADAPAVVDADTVTVEAAEAPAAPPDAGPDADPAEAMPEDAPAAPAPAPPAETEAAAAPSAPAKAPAEAAESGLSAVTFFNSTGMDISHLYIAGCDESEGNDWSDMPSWAQERLGGTALAPDASTVIEVADGCYVAEPHYVGGAPISEKVLVDGPTRVDFTIG